MPTADGEDPQDRSAAQGPPLFVNPDDLAAQQYAPPTFVKADGTPVQSTPPGQQFQAAPGAPVFVQPGGVPGALPASPSAAPAGYEVAGGAPGGPVFVTREPEHVALSDDRPWPWWLGPLAFAIAFASVMILGIGLAIVVGATGGDLDTAFDDNQQFLGLAQDVLWIAVVMLVPFVAVRYLRPEQLGLVRQPVGRSAGVLVACMVAFYVLAAAYSAALGLTEDSNTLLQDTGFGDSVSSDVLFALLFTVAAPVAEELLFRGLLFRTLRDGIMGRLGRRWGVALGALLSGVIFGGIHIGGGQDDFLPVLMMLGVLLALAYQWSGTLYVPVVLHSVNNALATGANSDPAADWIYGLIALGPVLSVATLWLLTRFIRSVFPQELPDPPAPPPPPPPAPPFQFEPSGRPANL